MSREFTLCIRQHGLTHSVERTGGSRLAQGQFGRQRRRPPPVAHPERWPHQPSMSTTSNPSAVMTTTRAGYDQWASYYDTDGNPILALEQPHVDRLLGDVSGLSVLDAGCGTGRHAIRLAGAGAMVDALDFSTGMLQQAREKAGAAGISFRVHDLSEPLPFPAGTFDRVVCGLVVDHIANLDGLFGEMLRVCRPSGWVVVSVMHPAMMLRGVQARFHDPKSGQEVRPASHAHQLSDYVMAAARAGCVFDHLSEHIVSEDLACRMERARRYAGWPMLFMMRLLPKRSAV
jgi:ubiquinone/menaquinone biosynthesis C-methylase UbiE